tara:strand:- start:172 stop:312 length:141 start_codon:yes stop_codon:yes gene_type:complete
MSFVHVTAVVVMLVAVTAVTAPRLISAMIATPVVRRVREKRAPRRA